MIPILIAMDINCLQERQGGVASRVSPFVRAGELGSLMNGAGLRLTTIDVDPVKIRYPSAAHLIEHQRSMGESNALKARATMQRYVIGCGRPLVYVSHEVAKYVYVLSRDIALAASAIYDQ